MFPVFLKSSFLAFVFVSCGVFAKEGDAPQEFPWSKVRCIWSCSFKACENVRILKHCAKNCAPENAAHCTSVAKTAFGEEILKSVLKTITTIPASPVAKTTKAESKPEIVNVQTVAPAQAEPVKPLPAQPVIQPTIAEKKDSTPKASEMPDPEALPNPFEETPEAEDATDAKLKEIIPEMQDAA